MERGDRVRLTADAITREVWPCLSKRYAKLGIKPREIRGTVWFYAEPFTRVVWDLYTVKEWIWPGYLEEGS